MAVARRRPLVHFPDGVPLSCGRGQLIALPLRIDSIDTACLSHDFRWQEFQRHPIALSQPASVILMDESLFESPYLLISQAHDQIKEARGIVDTFAASRPCVKVVDFDPVKKQDIYKVRLTAKLPGKLSAVIKDATGNLRDALDHSVFASAVALTGDRGIENTGFPFGNTAAHVQERLKSRALRGNPEALRPFLASFNPHEAGDHILWAMNQLRNPSTHRIVVPVGMNVGGGTFKTEFLAMVGGGSFGYSRWDPEKLELEYMRLGRGSVANYQVQFSLGVVFGDVRAVQGLDVFSVLAAMAGRVTEVVSAIKDETARLLAP